LGQIVCDLGAVDVDRDHRLTGLPEVALDVGVELLQLLEGARLIAPSGGPEQQDEEGQREECGTIHGGGSLAVVSQVKHSRLRTWLKAVSPRSFRQGITSASARTTRAAPAAPRRA